jgi:hypothetical protein
MHFAGIEAELDESDIALSLLDYVDSKIWDSVIDADKVPGHVDNKSVAPAI